MTEASVKKDLSRLETYYLTTNIKGLLILLLVIYHFVSGLMNSTAGGFLESFGTPGVLMLSPLVMSFLAATPIFVFITGYASKDTEACRNTAFSLYFVPYLVLMLITALEMLIFSGLPANIQPFEPLMQLWFLLSMFVWMLLLKDVSKIKFILPISIIVMIVSGMISNNGWLVFQTGLGSFLSLSRTVYYFPFLLLGFFTSSDILSRVRRSGVVKTAAAVLLFIGASVGIFALAVFNDHFSINSLRMLRGDGNYFGYLYQNGDKVMLDSFWKINLAGAGLTAVLVIASLLLLFIVIRLIPKKKIPFLTQLGSASFAVYCLHIFIVIPIATFTTKLSNAIAIPIDIICGLLICFLLSRNAVNKTFNKVIFGIGEAIKKKTKKA